MLVTCVICERHILIPNGDFIATCPDCPAILTSMKKLEERDVTVSDVEKKSLTIKARLLHLLNKRRVLEADMTGKLNIILYENQLKKIKMEEERLLNASKALNLLKGKLMGKMPEISLEELSEMVKKSLKDENYLLKVQLKASEEDNQSLVGKLHSKNQKYYGLKRMFTWKERRNRKRINRIFRKNKAQEENLKVIKLELEEKQQINKELEEKLMKSKAETVENLETRNRTLEWTIERLVSNLEAKQRSKEELQEQLNNLEAGFKEKLKKFQLEAAEVLEQLLKRNDSLFEKFQGKHKSEEELQEKIKKLEAELEDERKKAADLDKTLKNTVEQTRKLQIIHRIMQEAWSNKKNEESSELISEKQEKVLKLEKKLTKMKLEESSGVYSTEEEIRRHFRKLYVDEKKVREDLVAVGKKFRENMSRMNFCLNFEPQPSKVVNIPSQFD